MKFDLSQATANLTPAARRDLDNALAQIERAEYLFGGLGKATRLVATLAVKAFGASQPASPKHA